MQIAFNEPLLSLSNQTEIVANIYEAWELYDDHSTCDIVFPQLIHGVPWKFDYLIFKKNKQFAEENKKLQYAD